MLPSSTFFSGHQSYLYPSGVSLCGSFCWWADDSGSSVAVTNPWSGCQATSCSVAASHWLAGLGHEMAGYGTLGGGSLG